MIHKNNSDQKALTLTNNFLKNNILTIIGVILGGCAGYLYWYLVGCASGQCAITSSPVNSSIYGALMGGLSFNLFKTK